jgi:hypothetical protein
VSVWKRAERAAVEWLLELAGRSLMQHTGTHKIVKATTAALAAALLAVPVAQARLAVDARHTAPSNKHAIHQPVVKTDARHAVLLGKTGVSPLILQERRLSNMAKMHSQLGKLDVPTATTVSTVSTGFDWNDAGVGAGAALGLVLLATGGVLVTRRRLVSA